jgi:hypothetical protein
MIPSNLVDMDVSSFASSIAIDNTSSALISHHNNDQNGRLVLKPSPVAAIDLIHAGHILLDGISLHAPRYIFMHIVFYHFICHPEIVALEGE